MMKNLFHPRSAALSFLLTFPAWGQAPIPKSFLCVADKVTGFSFDKSRNEWVSTNFRPKNKYVLTRSERKDIAWEVKMFGEAGAHTLCPSDFNEVGFLFCEGFGSDFRFSRNTLRYMNVYLIGYWSSVASEATGKNEFSNEGSDTPSIEIGTCSPL